MGKISAGKAALEVLKGWGVDTVYGLPSGTLSGMMDSFAETDGIDFIIVRHEEVGALAAVMQSKFGGRLGVAVGSGGPGASHLIQGIYEARMDRVPLLVILGSREEKELNMDAFQELNQNPMYESPAIYNKRVAYASQLPKIMDEAARAAVTRRGPAVVEVPSDFPWEEIDQDSYYSSGPLYRMPDPPTLRQEEVDKAIEILNQAQRPVIYAGVGANESGDLVEALSKKIKAPITCTAKNYDAFDFYNEAFMGSAGRVAWKTANELIPEADTILFVGSNYPFAESTGIFDKADKFIQIDIDPYKIGKRHRADATILGDAGQALERILEGVKEVSDSPWYRANVKNGHNWKAYMASLENKESGDLEAYQVYKAINNHADKDAIYSVDVGNSTQTSIRHLKMGPENMWRTSPLFATMGIALPGGLAAKRAYPNRQVWNIIGDGAFNMTYPDIVTSVQYSLPAINIVFSNKEFGFIKNKYEDTNTHLFGTDFMDVDFAMAAQAQGAIGYRVEKIEDIDRVIGQAVKDYQSGRTVVVDCKISRARPIPVEDLKLDAKFYSNEEVESFKTRYQAQELRPFREFLEEEGLESRTNK